MMLAWQALLVAPGTRAWAGSLMGLGRRCFAERASLLSSVIWGTGEARFLSRALRLLLRVDIVRGISIKAGW